MAERNRSVIRADFAKMIMHKTIDMEISVTEVEKLAGIAKSHLSRALHETSYMSKEKWDRILDVLKFTDREKSKFYRTVTLTKPKVSKIASMSDEQFEEYIQELRDKRTNSKQGVNHENQ